MKGDGEVGRGRRVVCHLGLGFGFNFGSINAARLGRRMICGYNACCGWNKYILKFRRDPPSPFSLSSVAVCRWHLGFIDFCGWLLWGKHGVGRLSFSLSLDSSWGVFNWLRFWFGSLCFSFLGVPTPRHMQLSAHVCSCPASSPAWGTCATFHVKFYNFWRANARVATLTPHWLEWILALASWPSSFPLLPSADWRVTCIWVATLCGGGRGVRSCSPPCVALGLWLLVLVLRFLRLLCFHILLCSFVFVFVCFAVCFLLLVFECVCVWVCFYFGN